MIQVKTKHIILGILIVLTGFFFLGWYLGSVKVQRSSNAQLSTLNGIITSQEVQIGEQTLYISSVERELSTTRNAFLDKDIELAKLKALHLKTVEEVTYLRGRVQILRDSLAHNGKVVIVKPCDTEEEQYPAIILPFEFHNPDTSNYKMTGYFDEDANMFIDLIVPFDVDVWLGKDKNTKKYVATVTSNNPVVEITGIRSVKYDLPQPKKIGVGLNAGYGIYKNGLSPYVGIGVSWNFIRF